MKKLETVSVLVENGKKDEDHKSSESSQGSFAIRHLQFAMLFWGSALIFAMRNNLSVAIVQMTDPKNSNSNDTIFNWDQSTQQLILSSFFWGYTISNIPGGYISKKYGAKYTLLVSVFLSAILTLITPVVTIYYDWQGILIIRIFQGIMQGVTMPAIIDFCAKWCAVDDRGYGVGSSGSGETFGTFVTFLASGEIAYTMGWPNVFYIFGGVTIVWCIIWLLVSASTPSQHWFISKNEVNCIINSLNHTENTHKENIQIPWLQMFKSVPFWVAVIQHMPTVWIITLLSTQIPLYFHHIFKIGIESNGLFSSMPFLGRFIMEFFFLGVEFYLIKNQLLSLGFRRRCFHTIGQLIPAIMFAGFAFIPNEFILVAVFVLIFANGSNAATGLGGLLNFIDLSPHHAGVIMGICNAVGSVVSITASFAVGEIVTDPVNQYQWQIIFLITACITLFGNGIFIFLGSTKVQKWNELKQKTESGEKL